MEKENGFVEVPMSHKMPPQLKYMIKTMAAARKQSVKDYMNEVMYKVTSQLMKESGTLHFYASQYEAVTGEKFVHGLYPLKQSKPPEETEDEDNGDTVIPAPDTDPLITEASDT